MRKSASFFSLFFLAVVFIVFYLAPFTCFPKSLSHNLVWLRLLLILLCIFLLFKILHLIFHSGKGETAKRFAIIMTSLLVVFFCLEAVFMFIPISDGASVTLAGRLWFTRYWRQNKLGYRDKENSEHNIEGKKKIFVVGDSFVAGHGINDPSDRFSDVLREKLGNRYDVFNLGVCGADTRQEYKNLVSFPVRPDFIIVCHHPNDIETLRLQKSNDVSSFPPFPLERRKPEDLAKIIWKANFLTENSYFLSYLVYKWKGIKTVLFGKNKGKATKEYYMSEEGQKNYLSFYLNEQLFKFHCEDLHQFILLCEKEKVPLMFVLFPETPDAVIDYSQDYINIPLENYLNSCHVPVLNTYRVFKGIPEKERLVNWSDAHPSVMTHHALAEELYKAFLKEK